MNSDLTKAKDRPTTILRQHDNGDTAVLVLGSPNANAANLLSRYEQDHNVTFVALDNDALANLYEAFDELVNDNGDGADLLYRLTNKRREIVGLVEDLLGIDPEVHETASVSREPVDEVVHIISAAGDLTSAILEAAEETYDGWFDNDEPIDWEDFIDRLADPDGNGKAGRFEFDEYDNPAIRRIQKHIRAYRKLGQ